MLRFQDTVCLYLKNYVHFWWNCVLFVIILHVFCVIEEHSIECSERERERGLPNLVFKKDPFNFQYKDVS